MLPGSACCSRTWKPGLAPSDQPSDRGLLRHAEFMISSLDLGGVS